MPALIIQSFPESLHARLRQTATAHRRSVTQETIRLLEKALIDEAAEPPEPTQRSYWTKRKLLPEYEAALMSGAFSGETDSTLIVSEERDAK